MTRFEKRLKVKNERRLFNWSSDYDRLVWVCHDGGIVSGRYGFCVKRFYSKNTTTSNRSVPAGCSCEWVCFILDQTMKYVLFLLLCFPMSAQASLVLIDIRDAPSTSITTEKIKYWEYDGQE